MKSITDKIILNKTNTGLFVQLVLTNGKTRIGKKYVFGKTKKPVEASIDFGNDFGQAVIEAGIKKIRFDRNAQVYHGQIKSFADGLRKAGLEL